MHQQKDLLIPYNFLVNLSPEGEKLFCKKHITRFDRKPYKLIFNVVLSEKYLNRAGKFLV